MNFRMILPGVVTLISLWIIITPIESSARDMQDSIGSDLLSMSYQAENEQDYTQAIDNMLQLEKHEPEDFFYKLRLGWLYYSSAQYIEADKFYHQAKRLQPESLEAQYGIMNCAYAIGLWANVVSTGLEILNVDPLNSYALTSVAYSYYSQKSYQQAIAIYERIQRYYPADLGSLAYLGWSYHFAGDDRNARKTFEMLLKYSPLNESAISGLQAID